MNETGMLSCDEVLRVIFDYLDGELEKTDQTLVEAHLERCRSCFSRAEFERLLKARMSELRRERVSPAFESRIRVMMDRFAVPE